MCLRIDHWWFFFIYACFTFSSLYFLLKILLQGFLTNFLPRWSNGDRKINQSYCNIWVNALVYSFQSQSMIQMLTKRKIVKLERNFSWVPGVEENKIVWIKWEKNKRYNVKSTWCLNQIWTKNSLKNNY